MEILRKKVSLSQCLKTGIRKKSTGWNKYSRSSATYQKHDLAVKHRKILLHPVSLGSAKIKFLERSAIAHDPNCFHCKLCLIRKILWSIIRKIFSLEYLWKWKVYGKDQSFFIHPLGWPGKSTDLGINQFGWEYSFKLNVVIVTVVQSCSCEELISAG